MSTLKVTNIQDTAGGNSSTSADIYSGRAKAWVNFNGQGTVAIRADFNVSSITDRGTGNYNVNFTTAMVDANHSVSCTIERHNGQINGPGTVNYAWVQGRTAFDNAYDSNIVCVIVYR